MEYVKLGRTGLDVSRLTLGCMIYGAPDRGSHTWTLDEEASRPLIRKALDSRAQGALSWVIQKLGVTGPIIGASNNKPQHLDDAVAALHLQLTPDEIESLEAPYVPHRIVGFR